MRRLVLLGLALLPGGCGEEAPEPREPGTVAARNDAAPGPAADWLAPTDATEPALWLARRASGGESVDPAGVAALRARLGAARAHFVEDPRMIANRTAQLGAMLAEIGQSEGPEALVAALTEVAALGRGRQLYGELCQHYVTIRRTGLGREAALARLRERYAAQGQP